ncbi:MAG: hypothetical protein QW802_02275 [Candidatus Altiarchaeota archaeon]
MDLNRIQFLAKYPFLEDAKKYVGELNLNFKTLKEHPIYSIALEHGRQRVIDALNSTLSLNFEDKISAEFSILSFAVARILVHATKNKMIVEKYAEAETQQIFEFLSRENEKTIELIANDLNIRFLDGEMPFQEYLKLTRNLSKKDSKWKLANREIFRGKVKIYENEKLLLIREAIREKIIEPIEPSMLSQIPKEFSEIAKNLNSLFTAKQRISFKEIQEDALPNCIKQMLKALSSGEISHNGMFILATFFINLGLEKERIIKIFSAFPKFSEEKTRYQVEFLSGEKSSVKYNCPGCDKIKAYGLCPEDCKAKHPLKFYRKKYAEIKKNAKKNFS